MKKKFLHNSGKLQFTRMQAVIVIFFALILVLIVFQKNVVYQPQERVLELLPQETKEERAERLAERETLNKECLLIWQDSEMGKNGREEMSAILDQMRIPFDALEAGEFEWETPDDYTHIVLSLDDLGLLGEDLLDMMGWVRDGGNLMLLYPPELNGSFQMIQDKLGIVSIGNDFSVVEGMHFTKAFMLGTEGKDYVITDPFESSMTVQLEEDCEIYVESTGQSAVPLIWSRKVGEGSIVVDNLGFLEKAYRGIHCAAYSLLGDSCVWPVINGSVFYIDDFPSPVPGGDSSRIKSDYGMTIKEFYTQVWWNNVHGLAEKYGVRYTGLVIEEYSDQVKAPFERNEDLQRYTYFGNMLLGQGGEIGFHGYNHMPLVLENFDYMGLFDSYRQWASYEDMKAGITELSEFCALLFPKEKFQVYVPPSNILSEEGRAMLAEEFPDIKAIASVYLPGDLAYEQEFEEAEDGIVETPRIISGYILDDYVQITALSELNLHFVNSHFQHPDDVLDEDRGADLGWEEMFRRISAYMEWLYTSAPDIRSFTGSEIAAAVQRFDRLSVKRYDTGSSLILELGGFTDEAWMLVRLNEGTPGDVDGGSLTEVLDGLYLLKAEKERIEISIE